MPFSKSLQQPFRKNVLFVGAGYRALFATYNIQLGSAVASTALGPSILDLQTALPINTNAPPAGWTDLGWIKNFKIQPASKIGQIRSGYRGAVRAQYRGEVGETIDFRFQEVTRMAYKVASGCSPFNLLANPTASTVGPLSGTGAQAVPVGASGYQVNGLGATAGSPTVFVPAGSGAAFPVGTYIVCDDNYVPNVAGLAGDAGIPLQVGQVQDINFIRKTSDFVARVVAVSPTAIAGQDGLVLDQPFVGGGSGVNTNTGQYNYPDANSFVQKINGWSVREGATFITEWSGLFVSDTIDAAQISFYYPHLSIQQFKDIPMFAIENQGTTDQAEYGLDTTMEALAFDDPLDGETLVRYFNFIPRPNQNIAI
jgi:hypothetical protein